MLKATRVLALSAAMLTATSLSAPAGDPAPAFSDTQKEALHKIIHDYLVANPEVLLEVNDELQKKVHAKLAERRKPLLKQLYASTPPTSIGNGKITVVEFFDYNCSVCRHAFSDIMNLTETDKDVRVVFLEMPIFEDSAPLVKASVASAKQGKYFEYHKAMISYKGRLTEADALRIAKEVGLDVEQLKKDMNSPEVEKTIQDNLRMAEALGVNGTPSFFIGDINIPGAPDAQQLKDSVEATRKSCSVC